MTEVSLTRHPNYPNIIISSRERWRDVPGYEGLYRCSTWGRVKRLAGMKKVRNGGLQPIPERMVAIMSDGPSRRGVALWKDNKQKSFLLHRLILLTFVGPCPEGMEGCHNDGNASNNRLENLRWDTHRGNMEDTVKHGTREKMGNYTGRGPGILKCLVPEMIELYKSGKWTVVQLAEKYGVHIATIGYHLKKNNVKRIYFNSFGHKNK